MSRSRCDVQGRFRVRDGLLLGLGQGKGNRSDAAPFRAAAKEKFPRHDERSPAGASVSPNATVWAAAKGCQDGKQQRESADAPAALWTAPCQADGRPLGSAGARAASRHTSKAKRWLGAASIDFSAI